MALGCDVSPCWSVFALKCPTTLLPVPVFVTLNTQDGAARLLLYTAGYRPTGPLSHWSELLLPPCELAASDGS